MNSLKSRIFNNEYIPKPEMLRVNNILYYPFALEISVNQHWLR